MAKLSTLQHACIYIYISLSLSLSLCLSVSLSLSLYLFPLHLSHLLFSMGLSLSLSLYLLLNQSIESGHTRLKLSENFERHWSILISGEIHMDQSLVHTFSWGNSYGPMVLKFLLKFPPTLVLVHGWLLPVHSHQSGSPQSAGRSCETPTACDMLA